MQSPASHIIWSLGQQRYHGRLQKALEEKKEKEKKEKEKRKSEEKEMNLGKIFIQPRAHV